MNFIRHYNSNSEDKNIKRITLRFDTLIRIQEAVEECKKDNKDENAWSQDVVKPLLKIALHKPEASIWRVKSVCR